MHIPAKLIAAALSPLHVYALTRVVSYKLTDCIHSLMPLQFLHHGPTMERIKRRHPTLQISICQTSDSWSMPLSKIKLKEQISFWEGGQPRAEKQAAFKHYKKLQLSQDLCTLRACHHDFPLCLLFSEQLFLVWNELLGDFGVVTHSLNKLCLCTDLVAG